MTNSNLTTLTISNDLWLEKYRPQNLEDYIGKEDDIEQIIDWLENFNTRPEKFLVLYGNPGVGKTTLARIILKKYNYEIVEINTSDYRSKKMIHARIGVISGSSVILDNNYNKKNPFKTKKYKKIGVLMDEIDGITMNTENSGIQELIDLIVGIKKNKKANKFPVICTCNSIKNRKIKLLTSNALTLKIINPTQSELKELGLKIINNENIKIKPSLFNKIITYIKEYRELINILYQIYIYNKNGDLLSKKIITLKEKKELNIDYIIKYFLNKNNDDIILCKNTKTVKKKIDSNDTSVATSIFTSKYASTDTIDTTYITDKNVNYLDTVQEKLKYILINKINKNNLFLLINNNTNVYFLNLASNYLNIINYLKIKDKSLELKTIHNIITNIVYGEYYNSYIFTNQNWELNNYIAWISIISNINILKTLDYTENISAKTEKTTPKLNKNINLYHHYEFNKMAQDEGFFNRRKTILNNNIQVNDLQSLYYIDKIMNSTKPVKKQSTKIKSPKKDSKNILSKSETQVNTILDTNEKINKKITDYFVNVL
jgi:hypothetical protein